jgi:hypothetical protein
MLTEELVVGLCGAGMLMGFLLSIGSHGGWIG